MAGGRKGSAPKAGKYCVCNGPHARWGCPVGLPDAPDDGILPPDYNLGPVLRSFPKLTGAGPSGPRIQHLLDAVEVPLQTPILHSLKAVVNILSSAKAAEFFQPHQFGVSCSMGAEKIAHGLRACVDRHWKDEGFSVLKLDMRNAFNVVSRQAFLSECSLHFPELYPWVLWCYGQHLILWHPMGTLTSECGVQQGDPLGPLLFCLVLNILVKDICSDPNCANLSFHSWYLDDGVVAGPSLAVQKVLALIEEKGPPLGLLVNFSKCEVFSPTDVNLFREFCSNYISNKCASAKLLLRKLEAVGAQDAQVALVLLRLCGSFCKLAHLARATPPSLSIKALELFDIDIQINAYFIHANNPAPTHLDPTIAAVTLDIIKLIPTVMTCINTPGSYQCGCTIGYALANDGRSCIDVNECSLNAGLGYCQQKCTNTVGSYYCSCNTGYTQFGYYCNDTNECLHNPCPQSCTNTLGSYYCSCYSGYNQVGSNCYDIDECSSTNDGLGLCEQICINEPGSFHCDCREGYALTDKQHSFLDGWCNVTYAAHICFPCPCQNGGVSQRCSRNESFLLPEICQCSGDYSGRFCEVAGISIMAPSIAIPLGLLFILLLIFMTIFFTRRRIRKKEDSASNP
eukprot:Em0002g962a